MLYPEDELQRGQAAQVSRARMMLDAAATSRDRSASDGRRPESVTVLHEFSASALPIEGGQEEAMRRYKRGVLVGTFLTDYLADKLAGLDPRLGELKENIRGKLAGTPQYRHLSASTIENRVWAVFRPVSPLFAAYLQLAARSHNIRAGYPFSCHLDDLPLFLGIAEAFRLKGEDCQLVRYGHKLLPRGVSWAVPPEIPLPRIDLGLASPSP